MVRDVKYFLIDIGMMKYYNIFHAQGFDLESDVEHLTPFDLEESLMISSPREREYILYNAKQYKPRERVELNDWLHTHHLDHYAESFERSEITDLKAIAALNLPNEELYDELEIVMPGHRRRLERAVKHLRQDQEQRPMASGWWGKPVCLPQAKFDFLCVRGSLFSSSEPQRQVEVDFMVDSGSDVSTVQEDTMKQLDLELLGSVYSAGIHGGNHCNLYKANLCIGGQVMVVEIMASNYDSIGSRVIRQFRHVIDGEKHDWLKGNYTDPLPAVLPLPPPVSVQNSSHQSHSLKEILPPQIDIKPAVLDILQTSTHNTTNGHNCSTKDTNKLHMDQNLLKTKTGENEKRKVSEGFPDSKRQKLCQHSGNDIESVPNHKNSVSSNAEVPSHLRDTDDDVDNCFKEPFRESHCAGSISENADDIVHISLDDDCDDDSNHNDIPQSTLPSSSLSVLGNKRLPPDSDVISITFQELEDLDKTLH